MNNQKKNLGQFFTPINVAEFMCTLIDKPKNAKILEPSAGEGIFLKTLSNQGFENLTAYEIDENLKNKSNVNIINQDFLSLKKDPTYDVVIGNPPYVRWKNIPEYIKVGLKSDKYWNGKINGLSDLLYPFIYSCIDLLKKNGELIFITPIFWTQTQHSKALRKFMSENGELSHFIIFNEMPIFNDVSSSIIIFKYIKRRTNSSIKVIEFFGKEKLSKTILEDIPKIFNHLEKEDYLSGENFEAYYHPQFQNSNLWKPLSPKIKPFLDKVEKSCTSKSITVTVDLNGKTVHHPLSQLFDESDLDELGIPKELCKKIRFANKYYYLVYSNQSTLFNDSSNESYRYIKLGDVAEIGNGMVSGLDKAFKVSTNEFNKKEKSKFLNVMKASSLKKYFTGEKSQYIFVNDVESEEILKNDFPNIFNHLIKFRPSLEKRYNYGRYIPWWEWVFLRNKKLMENNNEKILVPCKERIDSKGYVRFSYIEGDFYATQDVTSIVKKPQFRENIKYLLAILNSEIIYNWIKYKGLSRGGVVEFSERPLSIIPIRLIDWKNEEEVRIHDEIVTLIDLILENKEEAENRIKIEEKLKKLYLS